MKTTKLFFVFLFVSFFSISALQAFDFTVRDCSSDVQLRGAISTINRRNDLSSTITLPTDCHITLQGSANDDTNRNGDLDIVRNVTIRGVSPQSTSINGGGLDRIFHLRKDPNPSIPEGPRVTIENLTLHNGNVNDAGGAILVGAFSQLTLRNSIVIDNNASGEITINRSQRVRNYRDEYVTEPVTARIPGGEGGGIFVGGSGRANLENVAIANNTANACGGGLCNYGSTTLNRVTLDNNTANYYGGGIGNGRLSYRVIGEAIRDDLRDGVPATVDVTGAPSGALVLINVTLYRNRVNGLGNGGGLANVEGSTAYINNSTINGNIAGYKGGGISNGYYRPSTPLPPLPSCAEYRGTGCPGTVLGGSYEPSPSPGALYLKNSIVADNQIDLSSPRGNNCEGTLTSRGYNISNDNTCSLIESSDLTNTNPLLQAFGYYFEDYPYLGSVTWTTGLDPHSRAINRIPPRACFAENSDGQIPLSTDARAIPRPQGGNCDVGAFEGEAKLEISPRGNPPILSFGSYDSRAGRPFPLSQSIRFTNTGYIPVEIRSSTLPVAAHFRISRNTCVNSTGNPIPIPPDNSCIIEISFSAGTSYGTFDETIRFQTTAFNFNTPDGAHGRFEASLWGENVAPPITPSLGHGIRISPQPVPILSTTTGIPVTRSIDMTNTGDEATVNYALSGPGASQFSLSANPYCNSGVLLRVGDTCQLTLTFNPATDGNFTAQLDVSSTAGTLGSVQSIPLNGRAIALPTTPPPPTAICGNSICETGETVSCPADCTPPPPPPPPPSTPGSLLLTPNPLVFTPIASGASAEQNLEVRNNGTNPVSLDDAYISMGDTHYTVRPGSCTLGSTLNPGLSCNLLIRFSPTVSGSTLGGNIKVVFNGSTQLILGILQGSSLPDRSGASTRLEVTLRSPASSSGPEVRAQANSNIVATCIYKLDGVIVHTEITPSTNHEFNLPRLRNGIHTLVLNCRNGDINGEATSSWTSSGDSPTGAGPGSESPGDSPSVGATGSGPGASPGATGGTTPGSGTSSTPSDPGMSGSGGTGCSLNKQAESSPPFALSVFGMWITLLFLLRCKKQGKINFFTESRKC